MSNLQERNVAALLAAVKALGARVEALEAALHAQSATIASLQSTVNAVRQAHAIQLAASYGSGGTK